MRDQTGCEVMSPGKETSHGRLFTAPQSEVLCEMRETPTVGKGESTEEVVRGSLERMEEAV